MTTAAGPNTPEPDKSADIEEIERDIEATRAELGQTVDALSAKLDVKAQARVKADQVRQQATDAVASARKTAQEQPQVAAGAGVAVVAALAAVVGLTTWRRRRARRTRRARLAR